MQQHVMHYNVYFPTVLNKKKEIVNYKHTMIQLEMENGEKLVKFLISNIFYISITHVLNNWCQTNVNIAHRYIELHKPLK